MTPEPRDLLTMFEMVQIKDNNKPPLLQTIYYHIRNKCAIL